MTPVATAVLITITRDGEVEHLGLPPFVAEAIAAAERARREAVPDAGAPEHALPCPGKPWPGSGLLDGAQDREAPDDAAGGAG